MLPDAAIIIVIITVIAYTSYYSDAVHNKSWIFGFNLDAWEEERTEKHTQRIAKELWLNFHKILRFCAANIYTNHVRACFVPSTDKCVHTELPELKNVRNIKEPNTQFKLVYILVILRTILLFCVCKYLRALARFLLEMVEKRNHKLEWIITLSCCNWQIGTKDRLTVVASAHKLYGFEMFLIHNIRIVSILPAFLRNIHCYSHLHSAKLNFLFRAMKKVSFTITRDDVFLSIFRSPTTNRFRSVKTCLHCDNTLISVQQSHVAVLLLF